MMGIEESALLIPCEGERLLAVISRPAGATSRRSGVVIVVGGPQVRVGSHRQCVSLARHLAREGWPCLRFDVRGMGDSTGTLQNFEHITPDIACVVDALCREAGVQAIMLWGLCDGASAALLYQAERRDPRVAGLCLLNPWARSAQSMAHTHVHHYYPRRLADPAFWRKLISGGLSLGSLRDFWANLRATRGANTAFGGSTCFQNRMAQAWHAFAGPMQLVLSGNDLTAREFTEYVSSAPEWAGWRGKSGLSILEMPGADHTFSELVQQRKLETEVTHWWQAQEPRS
jgi:exosortase A-associated hydrolase 1